MPIGFGCYTKELELYSLGTGDPLMVFEGGCNIIWSVS